MQATRNHGARRSGYPATYRSREVGVVARWILQGTSGAVIGMGGAGKSNFLRFLCTQPAALKALGVDLYTIGLGAPADVDEALLRAIATSPDRYRHAPDAEDLAAIYRDLGRRVNCN